MQGVGEMDTMPVVAVEETALILTFGQDKE
jgi:hypothetical protein